LLAKARFRLRNALELTWETKGVNEIRGSFESEFLGIPPNGTLGSPFKFATDGVQLEIQDDKKTTPYSRKMAFKER
jgi:hypothetical protein